MTDKTPKRLRLTPEQADVLARDLVRQLAQHVSDSDGVAATMRRWQQQMDRAQFGVICMAAIRICFRDCMSEVPAEDVPAGAAVFTRGAAA